MVKVVSLMREELTVRDTGEGSSGGKMRTDETEPKSKHSRHHSSNTYTSHPDLGF